MTVRAVVVLGVAGLILATNGGLLALVWPVIVAVWLTDPVVVSLLAVVVVLPAGALVLQLVEGHGDGRSGGTPMVPVRGWVPATPDPDPPGVPVVEAVVIPFAGRRAA